MTLNYSEADVAAEDADEASFDLALADLSRAISPLAVLHWDRLPRDIRSALALTQSFASRPRS